MSVSIAVDSTTAIVTLQSDDGLNRLSLGVLRELSDALHRCDHDPKIRGLVLAAEGRTFSAGADIDEFPYGGDADRFLQEVLQLIAAPEQIAKPVVAAVEGSAFAGGFELTLACDWIIAAADARLGLPEVTFGFMPGYCISRLPSLVGEARARRIMLDPGPYTVEELGSLGIHISSPPDGIGVLEAAVTMCGRMQLGAPTSIRLVKSLTRRRADFNQVVAAYNYLFQLPEAVEGLTAFREKRSPNFWGQKLGLHDQ